MITGKIKIYPSDVLLSAPKTLSPWVIKIFLITSFFIGFIMIKLLIKLLSMANRYREACTYPFARGNSAEKHILKLVEPFY